uniref:Ig-like domain-containing protein n=1 Tax=Leptobrachium leishanense TaxID=445787 RepID=A0A8C5PUN4_9ANUR
MMNGAELFLVLLIVVAPVQEIFSDHTLQYYHTAVSSPDHEMPQYTSVGYVDRIQITRYSSDTGRSVPVAHWMERLEPEYWEEETRNNKQAQEASRRNVKIAMSRYNHTGFYTLQLIYSCEVRDDGSTRGYWLYGYDGKDFLALDTERRVYIPLSEKARLSAQRWNHLKVRAGERAKDYLEKDCIEWLKTYMEYGKKELDRKVRPGVKVSSHRSGSTMKLHCQVYGFYPRDVAVIWKKNRIDILPESNRHVLPNSDGTYQLRATAEVTPGDGASYSCHVDHSSLDEPLIIMLDGGEHFTSHYWIISAVTVSCITIAVYVYMFWKMRRSGRSIYSVVYRSVKQATSRDPQTADQPRQEAALPPLLNRQCVDRNASLADNRNPPAETTLLIITCPEVRGAINGAHEEPPGDRDPRIRGT